MSPAVDVLIPTCERPAALAATLTSLMAQDFQDYRVVVSDQGERTDAAAHPVVQAVAGVLEVRGREVMICKHLPRRGLAEQRQFLLDQARGRYALFLDDDVLLEPDVLGRLVRVLEDEDCGFAGAGLIGPSYRDEVRPQEQRIELWDGPVQPEEVRPGLPGWERWPLHNAANLLHVQERLGATPEGPVRYKVAWIGGCVLYDRGKLAACGGFGFWRDLPPEHAGEDVVAQQRVMARFGGCGVLPSGAYHQELPTTVTNRRVDAPAVLTA